MTFRSLKYLNKRSDYYCPPLAEKGKVGEEPDCAGSMIVGLNYSLSRAVEEAMPDRRSAREVQTMNRPFTALFMLMSVDGKISTGATDEMDVDRDFPLIVGLREGLHQYYEIEQTTDLWSFNTGRVQAKMGVNTREMPAKTPVSFVLLDNHHLNEHGVRYFCAKSKQFVLITTNRTHPAFDVKEENLHIIFQDNLSLASALTILKEQFGCEKLTIQSGGTVNGLFLREKLFDFVDVVVAPVLVGGKDTATLIDGRSLQASEELTQLGVLRLMEATPLQDSYLRLRYRVIE